MKWLAVYSSIGRRTCQHLPCAVTSRTGCIGRQPPPPSSPPRSRTPPTVVPGCCSAGLRSCPYPSAPGPATPCMPCPPVLPLCCPCMYYASSCRATQELLHLLWLQQYVTVLDFLWSFTPWGCGHLAAGPASPGTQRSGQLPQPPPPPPPRAPGPRTVPGLPCAPAASCGCSACKPRSRCSPSIRSVPRSRPCGRPRCPACCFRATEAWR